jgi:hypothetical protein
MYGNAYLTHCLVAATLLAWLRGVRDESRGYLKTDR